MQRYLVRRLMLTLVSLLILSMVVFSGLRLLKGDLALMMLGRTGLGGALVKAVDEDQLEEVREALGLDKPIPIQYVKWMQLVLQGDFGKSAYSQRPALEEVLEALPVTLQLAIMATILAWLVGVPCGLVAAVRRNTGLDTLLRLASIGGLAIPGFWIGALLISVPARLWQWTPLGPYVSFSEDPLGSLAHSFWPAAVLAIGMAAWLMRITRATMVEVLHKDYIRSARAKGLTGRAIVLGHALRNCLIPVVSQSGLQFGALLGGAVVMEQLFLLPGLGRLLIRSLLERDYAVAQASVLFIAVGFALINLLVDLTYSWLDPRIKYS